MSAISRMRLQSAAVKHIRELIKARQEGYEAVLAFVIQMDGVTEVRPNTVTHPEFGDCHGGSQSGRGNGSVPDLPCGTG